MLLNLTKNLREIVSQYPAPQSLSAEEQSILGLRFKAVLQHYIWFHKDVNHAEVKKLYRKLSLYFHPDKFDSDINKNEPTLLQKQDIINMAALFKKDNDNKEKEGFFKIIRDVYSGEFDPSLETLEQALVKPAAPKQPKTPKTKVTTSSTTSTADAHANYHQNAYSRSYSSNHHYQRPKQQHSYSQNYYQQQQSHGYWGYEQYKPREYTPAELFDFLEKKLTSLQNIDIDIYIEKLTLETIFNKFIQERKYNCLESLLHYLSFRKKLEIDHLNALLDYAIQQKNIHLAKLAIHYGATTVDAIYQEALKKYDDETLYVLFEALPSEHVLKNGLVDSKNSEYDFYYLSRMCSEWIISPFTYAKLTPAQKTILNSPEIYHYISQNKISVLKAVSLSIDELQLIQYPGFETYFKKIGDFDKALDNMKRKRSILSQPIIRELAYKGLQHRYHEGYGYRYSHYIPVELDELLSLSERHIENLNNQNVISLIKSDSLGFREGIYLNERQRDLLNHAWLRQEMYDTRRHYPLDVLNQVYYFKDKEIDLISAYSKVFPFFRLNDYLKLSKENKQKLENFMPILNKYSFTTIFSNGYGFSGLNFPSILKLSDEMVSKLAYPQSPELYFNQGEMGQYILEHLPVSFFEENKEASLEALFNNALFYASQNNMPELIDLYTKNHDTSDGTFLSSLFMTSKNCLNLYRLTNQKKQTLEEVALENNATKVINCIKGHTYYFDYVYQNVNYTSSYLKETAKDLVKGLILRIVP